MKNKFKSVIISSLLFIGLSPSVHAEVAYNKVTRKFYSIGADKKVDQNEYHNIIISLFKIMNSDQTGDINIIHKKMLQLLKSKKTAASKRVLFELEHYQANLLSSIALFLTEEEAFDLYQQIIE
ncbi:hypothetical protein [Candidatus Chromulinivorax destructor]|uniref:DUF4476 domain-containing protein n=1 Tax=Candidatus Chromulinivorax destructor TaxID=2066483 RepID=A0A345ZAI6_9BACT|nr:hypothetical protein [Candidatus Chromulinivorax destructor]AXK60303.1 hypothetical protein C0J27_00865 [Candidatus Chromulinivorax destructor]